MLVVVKGPECVAAEKHRISCIRSLLFNQLPKWGKAVLAFLNGEYLFWWIILYFYLHFIYMFNFIFPFIQLKAHWIICESVKWTIHMTNFVLCFLINIPILFHSVNWQLLTGLHKSLKLFMAGTYSTAQVSQTRQICQLHKVTWKMRKNFCP